ncbi:MAG TPA: hypothetical protein VFS28_02550, partial [Gemmatimonadales bacterium]|nr:hypothetical protein [Gemmatimonadales bacterium]
MTALATAAAILSPGVAAQAPALPTPTPIAWRHGPLDLSGPARSGTFVSAVGRRSIVMGDELGRFEMWGWPVKLL